MSVGFTRKNATVAKDDGLTRVTLNQGIKQFIDDKTFKPGFGAYQRPERRTTRP